MKDSIQFISALENNDIETLKKVPKADLHNHSILSVPLSVIENYAQKKFRPFPDEVSCIEEMNDYIMEIFTPEFFNKSSTEFIIENGIKYAISDGVKVLEMSVDCSCTDFYPDREKGMTDFLISMVKKYSKEIDFRPEVGMMRDAPMEDIESWVYPCIETGIFKSIDLYDVENAKPPEMFKKIYKKAKDAGMKLKAHVGEFGSAEIIRKTVDILELDEVQHGINAVESEEVMKWLANNKIRLNICPTSNVKLKRVASLKEHPIRKLFDIGIPVTINTDDVTLFCQSVSDEYMALYQEKVFSAAELNIIRENSLK